MDYATQKRYPKESVHFLNKVGYLPSKSLRLLTGSLPVVYRAYQGVNQSEALIESNAVTQDKCNFD